MLAPSRLLHLHLVTTVSAQTPSASVCTSTCRSSTLATHRHLHSYPFLAPWSHRKCHDALSSLRSSPRWTPRPRQAPSSPQRRQVPTMLLRPGTGAPRPSMASSRCRSHGLTSSCMPPHRGIAMEPHRAMPRPRSAGRKEARQQRQRPRLNPRLQAVCAAPDHGLHYHLAKLRPHHVTAPAPYARPGATREPQQCHRELFYLAVGP